MKLIKTRVTRAQMDAAVIEQIAHARSLNVDINSVCMCALFVEATNRRLYGERKPGSALNEVIQQLIRDARVARAEAEFKAKQGAEQAAREETERRKMIVMPGGRN